jgi:putative DNA primase/helicase
MNRSDSSSNGRGVERLVPFIHGERGAGKTTFLSTLEKIAGEYVTTTDVDLVLKARRDAGGENASPRRVALRGARLVLTDEIPVDAKLDEGRFKSLSGGDKISARGLFKEVEEFDATHCLFLVGNNLPQYRDPSGATAERIAIIGFDRVIPMGERRPRDIVMGEFTEEASGILNWILKGYQDYLAQGLNEPKEVISARGVLEAEQDMVGQFLTTECEFDKKFSIDRTTLYRRYLEWCLENEELGESQAKFTRRITRMAGCSRVQNKLRGLRILKRQPWDTKNW